MGGNLPGFVLSLMLALLLQALQLPDAVAPFRPLLLVLTLSYWALYDEDLPVLVSGWLLGLCCDVLYNAPLGQYALGFVTVAFFVGRFRGSLLVFPMIQALLLGLLPIWGLYVFLMFWIDGLTHHQADPLRRWLPLLTTTLVWPLAALALGGLRSNRSRRSLL
jgi:rod shape-determining protein MreD